MTLILCSFSCTLLLQCRGLLVSYFGSPSFSSVRAVRTFSWLFSCLFVCPGFVVYAC